MSKLSLNSVSPSVFQVNAESGSGIARQRADVVAKGRMLFFEHSAKGKNAMNAARGSTERVASLMNANAYKQLNEQFQAEHLLFAAKVCCAQNGAVAPDNFADFRRQGRNFYNNKQFYAVLQGIYQEIVTPIIPATYSEAVDMFADTVEVGFGTTETISISSNDIPIFQDSSWGASRSVPRNRFYSKDYTLNPQPKTAQINAKWHQLVGNNQDFGAFFANIVAGMYAKTMGMWNEAMTIAAADTSLVPTDLNYVFNSQNWMKAANKLSALNNIGINGLFSTGSMVPLSKVLPTEATGTTNVNMDAALATLLGDRYNRAGYLGEFMSVPLLPLRDAIVPGTQNTNPQTILGENDIWMMASNRRKPMTIAYTAETPISIEIDPVRDSADFEMALNLTIAIDAVATFASKIAHFTI
ncbi:hypothetical protein [Sutterella wadsworthensis]|jgi:hypothetical protein|uniref:hypothetical protein n=1 Tax=Sutterella wadsworthensis TaxID=40545 RepID=UPI002059A9BB|nr:MAG TPA: hypothetical protein [Caudoviricetes sp.]